MKKIITPSNKIWRERWDFFWMNYYPRSTKQRERYWDAMKKTIGVIYVREK